MKVAVFGGSFNPPHLAHVLAVTTVLATSDVERVLVIPTFQHPFAKLGVKSLAPYEDRVKMCELAMGWLPRVEISRVEEELGGESRTVRTLEHLAKLHPDWRMRFVIGADILVEAPKWYAFDRICAIAPPMVLGRCGWEDAKNEALALRAPEPLLPNISSTEVRDRLARGEYEALSMLVPRAVLDYARAHRVYAP